MERIPTSSGWEIAARAMGLVGRLWSGRITWLVSGRVHPGAAHPIHDATQEPSPTGTSFCPVDRHAGAVGSVRRSGANDWAIPWRSPGLLGEAIDVVGGHEVELFPANPRLPASTGVPPPARCDRNSPGEV